MENVDLFLDACFLFLGIGGVVFVIVKRERFDLWSGLLTCAAWVFKGIRQLYYDCFLITLEATLNAGKENDIFLLSQNTSILLHRLDMLIYLLLAIALVRMAYIGLFTRWYNKAQKILEE